MHCRHRADPGVALHKGRDRQRRNRQHRPEPPPRQQRALRQPGQANAQRNAQGYRQRDKPQGIAQQLSDARAKDQRLDCLPAGIDPYGNNKTRRQKRQQRKQNG